MLETPEFFSWMIGDWQGNCRTWFDPGKLADESIVSGTIANVFEGPFLRHVYSGTMKNKPRSGEELIAFNGVTGDFQVSWIDSFHMNYAIMYCHGHAIESGFSVRGNYDIEQGQPQWGWRTDYTRTASDELSIIAFNITPDGLDAKAVETIYRRK